MKEIPTLPECEWVIPVVNDSTRMATYDGTIRARDGDDLPLDDGALGAAQRAVVSALTRALDDVGRSLSEDEEDLIFVSTYLREARFKVETSDRAMDYSYPKDVPQQRLVGPWLPIRGVRGND